MDKDRKLIIAGNWKMNKTVAEALDLVNGLKRELVNVKELDLVVCPPFTALSEVSKAILDSNLRLGAQNMSEHTYGAYTGEIAAGMLREHLRGQAAQQAAVHAHQVGHVPRDKLVEDRFNLGMIPPQREHAPAGQQVEVFVPLLVPQVRPFAADVALVEADRAQHLDERRVNVIRVQVVLAALVLIEPAEKIGVHYRGKV